MEKSTMPSHMSFFNDLVPLLVETWKQNHYNQDVIHQILSEYPAFKREFKNTTPIELSKILMGEFDYIIKDISINHSDIVRESISRTLLLVNRDESVDNNVSCSTFGGVPLEKLTGSQRLLSRMLSLEIFEMLGERVDLTVSDKIIFKDTKQGDMFIQATDYDFSKYTIDGVLVYDNNTISFGDAQFIEKKESSNGMRLPIEKNPRCKDFNPYTLYPEDSDFDAMISTIPGEILDAPNHDMNLIETYCYKLYTFRLLTGMLGAYRSGTIYDHNNSLVRRIIRDDIADGRRPGYVANARFVGFV